MAPPTKSDTEVIALVAGMEAQSTSANKAFWRLVREVGERALAKRARPK
jgi:hypothetical protein